MTIIVKWIEDRNDILYIHLNDLWEWEEFHVAFARALEMAQIPDQFDVILDFTNGDKMPYGTITHFRHVVASRPPNHAMTVIIGANDMLRTIGSVLRRMYSGRLDRVQEARTVEEACDLIYESRKQPV